MKHTNYNVDLLYFEEVVGIIKMKSGIAKNGYFSYKYNSQELQEEFGLNVTAMDYRQYDNALGRFYSIDALSEVHLSETPYHFSLNNPIVYSDPSGLTPFDGMSLFNNSGSGVTFWVNDGVNGFKNQNGLYVTYDGSVFNFEDITAIVIKAKRFKGSSKVRFEDHFYGGVNYHAGISIREHVYSHANAYQYHRDAIWTKKWDDFQRDLDYGGAIPVFGEPIDFLNAVISAFRGRWGHAGLSLFAMVPVVGNASPVLKASLKYGDDGIELYRAVSKSELDDIAVNGIRNSPGYETGKLFATSAQDAANFGRLNYQFDKLPFTIIKTTISKKYNKMLYKGEMDLMQGVSVPNTLFKSLSNPKVLDNIPLPNHPWIK